MYQRGDIQMHFNNVWQKISMLLVKRKLQE